MGDLTPGDAALLRRMRAQRDRGTPAGHRFPLPPDASFTDGGVHRALREGGYVGPFRVGTDDDGQRFAVLTAFDDPGSWTTGLDL
ncbi:hypothetical protein [Gordonia terrae]